MQGVKNCTFSIDFIGAVVYDRMKRFFAKKVWRVYNTEGQMFR